MDDRKGGQKREGERGREREINKSRGIVDRWIVDKKKRTGKNYRRRGMDINTMINKQKEGEKVEGERKKLKKL